MANITCPQCNRFVDDTTKTCPGCKFNIRKYVKDMKKKGMSLTSSLSLNGVYAHNSEPSKFVPELEFLKGANTAPQLDPVRNTAPEAAATPQLDFTKTASAPAAQEPELDFLKKTAPAAETPAPQAPVQQTAPVDMFAPPIPQAPVNRPSVAAVNPADVFSQKAEASRQPIAPAPTQPVMSQAAAMAAYQEKREAAAAAQAAASYAQKPVVTPTPTVSAPPQPAMSQAAAMAAYQEKREAPRTSPYATAPTQPMASSALSRPISSPSMTTQTIQPVFESASLNAGVLNGGGALSGVLSGPTIMEKLAEEKRIQKENESVFESASLRKAEKELKAGTRQAAGGLHGELPLDAYRNNGVQRFGEASEYQRQMAAQAHGASGAVPPYAKQPPYAAPTSYGQAAPYAQQQVGGATAPGGLNPMFAAPQSNNPLFGGGMPQAAQNPYTQTAPGASNGLLAQPQASANPLYGGAPAGNPMFGQQPAAAPAAYQPVQQPAAPVAYQPVQQTTAPAGYQPVQQEGAPAGVFTGAPVGGYAPQPAAPVMGSALFGSQPAAPTGSAMFGQAPGQPVIPGQPVAVPGQPVGTPYGG